MKFNVVFIISALVLFNCDNESTTFGKNYNPIRKTHGSPIIHDYMRLQSTSSDFEHWRTPQSVIDDFKTGFHYGKGFYIHEDSILQEDDVFRIRLNDTTYNQINVLTYGNPDSVTFKCSFLKVDSRSVNRSAEEYLNDGKIFPEYEKTHITKQQADSILITWEINIRSNSE